MGGDTDAERHHRPGAGRADQLDSAINFDWSTGTRTFDLRVLAGHARRVGLPAPHHEYVDTLQLARRYVEAGSYRLDELATYGRGDQFDQAAAAGFIKLFGMSVRTASEVQGKLSSLDLDRLLPPDVKRLTP